MWIVYIQPNGGAFKYRADARFFSKCLLTSAEKGRDESYKNPKNYSSTNHAIKILL